MSYRLPKPAGRSFTPPFLSVAFVPDARLADCLLTEDERCL